MTRTLTRDIPRWRRRRALVLRSFLSSSSAKKASTGFRFCVDECARERVLHHRFFVCFSNLQDVVLKNLNILEILTKHAGHGGLPARAGFVCFVFLRKIFRQMGLCGRCQICCCCCYCEDTRLFAAKQNICFSSCVYFLLSVYFCDNRKNVSICTKT